MRVRTLLIGLAITVALASPAALSALTAEEIQVQIDALLTQIRDLRSQITSLEAEEASSSSAIRHRICGMLAQTLHEGDENEGVRALQEFLASEKWLTVAPTGFFGTLTRDALRRWQAHHQIVTGGDAETTGWGVFGPRSRAFLMRWCQGVVGAGNASPQLSNQTSTTTTAGNQPPTINSFDGPSTLTVNTNGTWTVNATDPEGRTLTYHVTWGDQASVFETLLALADLADFTSATTFSHSYASTGLYQVTIRVSDGQGGISGANAFVRVQTPGQTVTPWYSSTEVTNGGGSTSGSWRSIGSAVEAICPAASPSDPICFALPARKCTYNGQQYEDNARRVDSFCLDAEGSNPARCISTTHVCRTGVWQKFKPTLASCNMGGQLYPHGTSFDINPEGVSSLLGGSIGKSVCVDGEWISQYTVNQFNSRSDVGRTCKYLGTTYADGDTAPCTGIIGGLGNPYSSCEPPEGIEWAFNNVCRNGEWKQEAASAAGAISSGVSCTTPWGSQMISSGGTIGKEPYFTGGAYTGSSLIPLMRCSNGAWLQCDHQGNSCQAF